jgi:hypothetical protein
MVSVGVPGISVTRRASSPALHPSPCPRQRVPRRFVCRCVVFDPPLRAFERIAPVVTILPQVSDLGAPVELFRVFPALAIPDGAVPVERGATQTDAMVELLNRHLEEMCFAFEWRRGTGERVIYITSGQSCLLLWFCAWMAKRRNYP